MEAQFGKVEQHSHNLIIFDKILEVLVFAKSVIKHNNTYNINIMELSLAQKLSFLRK